MRTVLACALLLALAAPAAARDKLDRKACAFAGKRLYGKIQVVQSFPDVKVQVVESFPDLKVQRVTASPDRCGQWQLVTAFPDTRVQFVTSFPDVKIQYVESFPGMR